MICESEKQRYFIQQGGQMYAIELTPGEVPRFKAGMTLQHADQVSTQYLLFSTDTVHRCMASHTQCSTDLETPGVEWCRARIWYL